MAPRRDSCTSSSNHRLGQDVAVRAEQESSVFLTPDATPQSGNLLPAGLGLPSLAASFSDSWKDNGDVQSVGSDPQAALASSDSSDWTEVRAGKRRSKTGQVKDLSASPPSRAPSGLAPAPFQQVMGAAGPLRAGEEGATGRARKLTRKFEVGIHSECGFHVVRRLIGAAGANMKRIVETSMGAKVWVTGRDSPLPEGGDWQESVGPLLVCVSAASGPSFEIAKELVMELLDTVRQEHHEFCLSGKAQFAQ